MNQKKFFVLFAMLLSIVSYNASAHDFEVDGIFYLYETGSTVSVTFKGDSWEDYFSEYSGHIEIPASVSHNGRTYSVISIGDDAFNDCLDLESVSIPQSVTTIGSNAFYNCGGLTSLTIPSSVTSIGEGAFYSCISLTSLNIPEGVTSIGDFTFANSGLVSLIIPLGVTDIGYSAFSNCDGLESVVIPKSVATIGYYAFSGCTSLRTITIPSGVMTIEEGAFSDCSGLYSVAFASSVIRSIGEGAFEGCTSLASVTIPSSVTSIGKNVFSNCSNLNSIKVEESNSIFDSRNNCNAIIETQSNKLLYGCKNSIIPQGVTSIGSNAFYGCGGLKSVAIPKSVTTIEAWAFQWSGLTSVTISEGVTTIGNYAFSGCNLTSITVETDNSTYDSRDDCNAIIETSSNTLIIGCKNTTIPSTVTSIGNLAFWACSGLSTVTIPSSVTIIGDQAFESCSNLKSVTIPSNVTKIGGGAFYNCGRLSTVTIPSSVTTIGDEAFSGCYGLTLVTIQEGVTSFGSWAFEGCRGLVSVTIPSSVTSIGKSAFNGCSGLISVTAMMETPVSIIDSYTFSNRKNATLYVPYGCKSAYEAADYWKEFMEIVEIDMKDKDNYIMPAVSIACKGGQATLPILMNNVEQIVGFQFDLQLPEGVTLATNGNGTLAASLTDRASDHSLTVSKVGEGLYRFISVSMSNNAFAGNEGALLNVKLLVDESVAVGDYEVTVTNTELTASDQTEIHSVDGTATLTVRKAEPGDVNGDGKLSVSDVASIIGYVLNDRPAIFIESTADLNGSNTISVTDAVIVIDKILNANTSAGARRTEEPENEPQ